MDTCSLEKLLITIDSCYQIYELLSVNRWKYERNAMISILKIAKFCSKNSYDSTLSSPLTHSQRTWFKISLGSFKKLSFPISVNNYGDLIKLHKVSTFKDDKFSNIKFIIYGFYRQMLCRFNDSQVSFESKFVINYYFSEINDVYSSRIVYKLHRSKNSYCLSMSL